ncbi:hypothetical protein NHQ30_000746 [Ciborinia camelliae]|nr:hypothetical protein NHQ30_000746 [Ciborinia camelliae]
MDILKVRKSKSAIHQRVEIGGLLSLARLATGSAYSLDHIQPEDLYNIKLDNNIGASAAPAIDRPDSPLTIENRTDEEVAAWPIQSGTDDGGWE